jgi:hypothetical protein
MSDELFRVNSTALPTLLAVTGDRASMRFLEFFAANIRKPHTRRAYYRAPRNFWPCDGTPRHARCSDLLESSFRL